MRQKWQLSDTKLGEVYFVESKSLTATHESTSFSKMLTFEKHGDPG